MKRVRRCSALVLAASLMVTAMTACASASSAASAATSQPRRSGDAITEAELTTLANDDLYATIQRLRPAFLQARGSTSLGAGTAAEAIQVYVDGIHVGDAQSLHQLR